MSSLTGTFLYFKAEVREAQRLQEEEEERLKEIDRQAEEEAMVNLIAEREAAEFKKRQLQAEEEYRLEEERKQL